MRLSGKGVHVVTVNDYLAARDAEWMGKLYNFLGLSVGVILTSMEHADKQVAYGADITYGTNNEFGFDYLRDNMAANAEDRFQRGLNFAIVDEVDSILIDEARTPLIISGQAEDNLDVYLAMDKLVPNLKRQADENAPGDFHVDEKNHQILLSESGHEHAERMLAQAGLLPVGGSLYDPANITLIHHLYAALRAHNLFFLDQHYVVQNDEVVIVDEFTGRLMSGRRWSDGLHQAVEAKEGVAIQKENQTLASITFQNYFRMYNKLSGMTGTADTEAYEFQTIYNLETVIIPPHRPTIRKDMMDKVYLSTGEKYTAVIADIRDCYERGQPVLVGTTSIETSELLSRPAGKSQAAASGAERQATCARSRDRGAGGQSEDDHHRHQHGGSRYGHRAGRQCGEAHRTGAHGRKSGCGNAKNSASHNCVPSGSRSMSKWLPAAACISSAPNATNRGAWTTSCAVVPAVRATPVPAVSICRWKTRCCAFSLPTVWRRS